MKVHAGTRVRGVGAAANADSVSSRRQSSSKRIFPSASTLSLFQLMEFKIPPCWPSNPGIAQPYIGAPRTAPITVYVLLPPSVPCRNEA